MTEEIQTVEFKPDKPKMVTFDDFAPKLLKRLKKPEKNTFDFILWTFPSGAEIAFFHKELPLGTLETEIKGCRYIIDQDMIKNRLGRLTYDTIVNDAQGALSFIKKHNQGVDAKNYAEGVRRNWFTALWGQWKLPFIALLISMGIALALGFATMYFAISARDSTALAEQHKSCLNSLPCLQSNIDRVNAEIEIARQQAGENAN